MTDLERAQMIDKMIMMELVSNKNRFKLAWYVLIGRAISVGYLVMPYKKY